MSNRRCVQLSISRTPLTDISQAVTGKEVVYGYDVNGRPALYLCPSKQNTNESSRQIEFTFWMLERVVDLMGPGIEYVFNISKLNMYSY